MKEVTVTLIVAGKPMSIAVYTRVSTDQQSIAHQRNAVAERLALHNYAPSQVVTYSDEGISGAINDSRRPGFTKLIESVMKGRVRRVLVFETSRLSRDFMSYLKFLEMCKAHSCLVEVIGKGPVDFATSEDMLLASIAAFTAQAERERIRERVKSGVKAAQERGVKFGAKKGDQRRLGYRKEHDQSLVEEVLTLRKDGLPLRSIARIVSKNGHILTHSTVAVIVRKYSKKSK